jgi:hypothetical protein
MRLKLNDLFNESPDTYFVFEGIHHTLHPNSGRSYLSLYNQSTRRVAINIEKSRSIDDIEIQRDGDKKQVVIYRKGVELISFEYLSHFAYNLELVREYSAKR